MTLSLISNPSKTKAGIKSRSVGAVSQVPYEFLHSDDTFTDVSQGAGDTLRVNGVDGTPYSIGEYVGVITDDGTIKGYGPIEGKTATHLRLSVFYDGGAQALPGTVYKIEDYVDLVLELNIYRGDNVQPLNESPLTYSFDRFGGVFLDLSGVFQSLTLSIHTFVYHIEYRERSEGSTPSFTADEQIQSVFALRQIHSFAGTNMWEYLMKKPPPLSMPVAVSNITVVSSTLVRCNVTSTASWSVGDIARVVSVNGLYNDIAELGVIGAGLFLEFLIDSDGRGNDLNGGILEAVPGKWLTTFTMTAYMRKWINWRGTISLLVDLDAASRTLGTEQITQYDLDVNKIPLVGSTSTIPFVISDPTVIQLPIEEPVHADAKYKFLYAKDSSNQPLTEYMTVEVLEECKRPIMVEWFNSLGGHDVWLFSYKHIINESPDSEISWEIPISEDYEYFEGSKRKLTLQVGSTILLTTENLTKEQVDAIKTMYSSPEIYIYLRKDGVEKIRVTVTDDWSYNYESKQSLYSLTVTLQLPKNFDILKALRYEF